MSRTAHALSLKDLHSDPHKQSILSKLDDLRRRDILCDITLVVEDVHFKAHKVLLAASSEYFSLMLTADDQISQSTYQLDGIAAKMFGAVLEFIYSAQVSVEESATEQLLATARRMEVSDLVNVLLTDLTQSAAGVKGEEVRAEKAEVKYQAKRNRRWPKKTVAETEPQGRSEACESSQQDGEPEDGDDVGQQSTPDSGHNTEAHQSWRRKRKIIPPLKYRAFKVGGDTTASKEPGRRGRKRKYPDTEARCDECGKVFKNHLFLKIHQRAHTGNVP